MLLLVLNKLGSRLGLKQKMLNSLKDGRTRRYFAFDHVQILSILFSITFKNVWKATLLRKFAQEGLTSDIPEYLMHLKNQQINQIF